MKCVAPLRATTDNLWVAACDVMYEAFDAVRVDKEPGNIGRASARAAIKEARPHVRCTPDNLDYVVYLAGEVAEMEMQRHERAMDWLVKARNGKKAARFRKRVRAWIRRR
jgi:hypothetical protein